MKNKLAQVFNELLREIDANPDLRARIEQHLSPSRSTDSPAVSPSKRKNRRGTPVLDPYAEIKLGEAHLKQVLTVLSIDQLKDIVSGYALDASRLALKWKEQARLIDFIITTVRGRIEKGDGFRSDSENTI